MFKQIGLWSCCLYALATPASAANWINAWGVSDGGAYTIDQSGMSVTIRAPGTYKFWASDLQGGLGVIDAITIDPGCPAGTVTVYVQKEDAWEGAYDIGTIDLSADGVTGELVLVLATHDIAYDTNDYVKAFRIPASIGYVYAGHAIAHDITLENLDGSIVCDSMKNLTVNATGYNNNGRVQIYHFVQDPPDDDAYADTIDIRGSWGGSITIDAGSLTASSVIRIGEDLSGSIACPFGSLRGQISIHGGVLPRVDSNNQLLPNIASQMLFGSIEVAADMDGYIALSAGVAEGGALTIGGDAYVIYQGGLMAAGAAIDIGGDLVATCYINGSFKGDLHVRGSWRGDFFADGGPTASQTGTLTIDGDLSGTMRFSTGYLTDNSSDASQGHIIVNGSFKSGAWIWVALGMRGNHPFTTIDYDGDDVADTWEDGAYVRIGSDYYYGNNPGAGVFETTCVPGDLDNSGTFDDNDILPFVVALFGGTEAYCRDYPAICGSALYHGDFTGDHQINNQDIDGFVRCRLEGCPCPVSVQSGSTQRPAHSAGRQRDDLEGAQLEP